MKKVCVILCGMIVLIFVLPNCLYAQDTVGSDVLHGLQDTLEKVHKTMLLNCSALITVSRGIAGIAALLYINNKVWGSYVRGQAIDFYPLLRPFCIGLIIGLFPAFINVFDGILSPTVDGTNKLVEDSKQGIAVLLQRKEEAEKQSDEWKMYVGPSGSGDIDKWEELSGEANDNWDLGVSNRVKFEMSKIAYNIKSQIRLWISEFLTLLYEAAALCINTVRIFYLVILAILGPLVFAISVFDGLHHVLINWIARYINVFLWLPIANIFASLINSIQQELIKLDIEHIQKTGESIFDGTALAYLVFLLMGIVGYTTIPSVANHIINPGSAGAHLAKMTNMGSAASQAASGAIGAKDGHAGEMSMTKDSPTKGGKVS